MKRSTSLIFTGTFGIALIFGIFAVRNYFKNRKYEEEYSDFHRNFG